MTAETSGGQAGQPPTGGTRSRPLHRSRTDRVLAGVCGGIAETYGADPTAVRLLAALIGIFTGIFPMLILYLVAAVIVPESADGEAAAEPLALPRLEPGQGTLIVGIVLLVAGVVALANQVFRIELGSVVAGRPDRVRRADRPPGDPAGGRLMVTHDMQRTTPSRDGSRAARWILDPRLPGLRVFAQRRSSDRDHARGVDGAWL